MITSKLQENLESSFEQGITSKNSELILRCLRTYALIDKTSHAEDMFKHLVVKPFVEETVNESYLAEHGLDNLCGEIIRFVADECRMIVTLTSTENLIKSDVVSVDDVSNNKQQQTVKGFDFLVNSVWVEIAQGFENNLPLIFSPGNPDSFLAVSICFLLKWEAVPLLCHFEYPF